MRRVEVEQVAGIPVYADTDAAECQGCSSLSCDGCCGVPNARDVVALGCAEGCSHPSHDDDEGCSHPHHDDTVAHHTGEKRGEVWQRDDGPGPVLADSANEPMQSVLRIADELIHGERAATHGPVTQTFGRVALLFDNMLTDDERRRMWVGNTPNTVVAKMLIALKLTRESFNPAHRDNLIDAAGYIGLLDELKAA